MHGDVEAGVGAYLLELRDVLLVKPQVARVQYSEGVLGVKGVWSME